MPSTIRESTCAVSLMGSPRPSWISDVDKNSAAQLIHARLKRNARARGGFGKDHRQRLTGKGRLLFTALLHVLEAQRQGQTLENFIPAPVLKGEQMLLGKRQFCLVVPKIHSDQPPL